MEELIAKIKSSRGSSAPVLITGETGTGKELIARAVHAISSRHKREFVPFDCGAVNSGLIESELFGHRRGSFTSADRDSKGVIREAEGGTLFLDEIGELHLEMQVKLLRFLQEGEVRPVGATRPIKTNVRVIAATNRDLEAEVQAGRFRNDLYYRLDKLRLRIPPLRERREDIPLLIEHFFRRHTQEMGKEGMRLSNEVLALMLGYHWPGNAREVENVLYRMVAFAGNGEEISPERFWEETGIRGSPPAAAMVEGRIVINPHLSYHEAKDELERLFIINALNETGGALSRAAARLGMSLPGLKKAIKRLGIKAHKDGHQ